MILLKRIAIKIIDLLRPFWPRLYNMSLTHDEYFNRFFPTYFPNVCIVSHTEFQKLSPPNSNIGFLPWKFSVYESRMINESFVAVFKNARVVSPKGLIVTAEKVLISNLSRSFGVPRILNYSSKKIFKDKRMSGKNVAVLTTDGSDTYYHWIFDILPRIYLLQQAGTFDEIDMFVLPELKYEFQKSSLAYFKIPQIKIVQISEYESILAENLIVPSLPSELGTVNKWALNFIRNSFLDLSKSIKPFRHIYISRKNSTSRKLLNENEIAEFLSGLGFDIIESENMPFEKQVILFSEAAVVISPHGSGLSNVVFCKKNTKVIDLFYGDFLVPCFWVIASQLELEYYYATSKDIKQDFKPYWESVGSNDYFPIDKLKKILKSAHISYE